MRIIKELSKLSVFIVSLLIMSCVAESDSKVPVLPFGAASETQEQRYSIPSVGNLGVTELTQSEKGAIKLAIKHQVERGLNSPEARQEQARGIKGLIDFSQSSEFTDSLRWTGPIEGMTPGMSLEEQADAYYEIMNEEIKGYSIEKLELLNSTIITWFYTLVDLEKKATLDSNTIQGGQLTYLKNKIATFRETVLQLRREKIQADLNNNSSIRSNESPFKIIQQRAIVSEALDSLSEAVDKQINGVNETEIAKAVVDALGMKLLVSGAFNQMGCGCNLKGGGPNEYNNENQIPRERSIFLLGDSRFKYMDRWYDAHGNSNIEGIPVNIPLGPDAYFTGYNGKIGNNAVGGSTSEDLRNHFDHCGNGQFDRFYPEIWPSHPEKTNHIQLSNKRSIILTGGNDFFIYEPILRALPWLIPFRHNNVLNNLNRMVSYHQAQGSEVIIMSQLPPTSADLNWNLLGDSNHLLQQLSDSLGTLFGGALKAVPFITPEATSVLALASCESCFKHPGMNSITEMGMYAIGLGMAFEEKFLSLLPNGQPADHTWLSQQMGHLSTVTVPFVVDKRKTGFVNAWFHFADPNSVAIGKWWVGTPLMYIGDGIHPSHPLGHGTIANALLPSMDSFSWKNNPMPSFGDRCNYLTGSNGTTNFPSGQPAIWTDEPEELPEADDNTVILIGLCFLFGIYEL